MRHNKIEFLYLYMPYLVNNYIFIRYEDLIEFTQDIINTISYNQSIKINLTSYYHLTEFICYHLL